MEDLGKILADVDISGSPARIKAMQQVIRLDNLDDKIHAALEQEDNTKIHEKIFNILRETNDKLETILKED